MKLLVVLIASLMVLAPQSFAQKDDYSALAKNCEYDAFYEASEASNGNKTMAEKYEKQWEMMVRRRYQMLSQEDDDFKEEYPNMTEDEYVKYCRYRLEENQKKKAKKG